MHIEAAFETGHRPRRSLRRAFKELTTTATCIEHVGGRKLSLAEAASAARSRLIFFDFVDAFGSRRPLSGILHNSGVLYVEGVTIC
jgi:hypothetical protein